MDHEQRHAPVLPTRRAGLGRATNRDADAAGHVPTGARRGGAVPGTDERWGGRRDGRQVWVAEVCVESSLQVQGVDKGWTMGGRFAAADGAPAWGWWTWTNGNGRRPCRLARGGAPTRGSWLWRARAWGRRVALCAWRLPCRAQTRGIVTLKCDSCCPATKTSQCWSKTIHPFVYPFLFILSVHSIPFLLSVKKTLLGFGAGQLGDQVTVSRDKFKITATVDIHMSKRYLKYLTKKYLKKHNVRDWLCVIASDKDRR